ncbi:MAG: Asp-tRNA(Asn)/Glu-tRNA(Gln) amidotransferase subunit GatB, partial [Chloroflexota bacterium]
MTQYEPVIGLEIHGELLTNSKMFCGCSADYGSAPEPNTNICPTCTGLPGAMPVVNKKATELAALVGLALNCSINKHNTFARKNYYYPDLPKGYQISQYELPIAEKGWMDVSPSPLTPLPKGEGDDSLPAVGEGLGMREQLRVRVRRVHIEEDTAKLSHEKNYALVDFNRAGVPLLEIVSEPDIRTVEAALDYATKIRAILRYLGVNSGDMEKGVLRFEANISVRPVGSDEFRTRTEIKNLNSFRALTRASTYEIERQIKVYEAGGTVVQETLGWDDVRGVTVSQRGKEEAHDYRYFPEPDLPPLQLSDAWIDAIRTRLPELPEAKTARFTTDFSLTPSDARFLTSELSLANYFESVAAKSKSPAKTVHSWIAGEFMRNLNDLNIDITNIPIDPSDLAQL